MQFFKNLLLTALIGAVTVAAAPAVAANGTSFLHYTLLYFILTEMTVQRPMLPALKPLAMMPNLAEEAQGMSAKAMTASRLPIA